MDNTIRPSTYAFPLCGEQIITVPVNPASGEYIAFFASAPTACQPGPDEANAVFALLKTSCTQDQAPAVQAHLAAAGVPGPGEDRVGFVWTRERTAQLTEAFAAHRQRDPKQSVVAIARAISIQYGWKEETVKYKIHNLRLHKQPHAPSSPPTRALAQMSAKEPVHILPSAAAPTITGTGAPTTGLPALQPGHVGWDICVDGTPLRILLDYPHGAWPYAANTAVTWRGNVYRVGRVRQASVDLTSQDADDLAAIISGAIKDLVNA